MILIIIVVAVVFFSFFLFRSSFWPINVCFVRVFYYTLHVNEEITTTVTHNNMYTTHSSEYGRRVRKSVRGKFTYYGLSQKWNTFPRSKKLIWINWCACVCVWCLPCVLLLIGAYFNECINKTHMRFQLTTCSMKRNGIFSFSDVSQCNAIHSIVFADWFCIAIVFPLNLRQKKNPSSSFFRCSSSDLNLIEWVISRLNAL